MKNISALFINLLLIVLLPLPLSGCIFFAATAVGGSVLMAHDRRTTGEIIEDKAIEIRIARQIDGDKELLTQAHTNVASYSAKVLITGEVPNEAAKQRVGEIAQRTNKVQKVYNEVVIAKPSTLVARTSDGAITTKAKTQLFMITNFDPTRVKIVTERGVVYLMGFLTRSESDAVANVVRRVGGVQKVVKLFEYITNP
jgi:osmotically-inducible protein OsmY